MTFTAKTKIRAFLHQIKQRCFKRMRAEATHPDLFSEAALVLAVGLFGSLSGRPDAFLKEAVLNEADERAATGQRRLIALDG